MELFLFICIKLVGLGGLEISTGGSLGWIFDRNPVRYMKCSQKFSSKAPDVDAVHWLLKFKGWFFRLVFLEKPNPLHDPVLKQSPIQDGGHVQVVAAEVKHIKATCNCMSYLELAEKKKKD